MSPPVHGPQVLCLGEVLWDELADQPGPYAEVKSWTSYPGGAPANVACRLAQLGTPTGFIGCVGQDEAGEALAKWLRQHQVDLTGSQRHAEAPTRRVYVTRSERGDRNFAGFGHHQNTDFADAYLQAQAIPESLFVAADYLVLGTLELAYPDTREAIMRALRLAHQHHLHVWVDVNWRPMFWPQPELAQPIVLDVLKHAQMLKLSVEEAQWLFGTTHPSEIAQCLPKTGVLVTAGEQGCFYQIGNHSGELQAFQVPVIDTTGAGDAFFAGFLHQCCQGKVMQDEAVLREMIRYASAVGALATTHPGAIAPQPADVDLFLSTHP